MFEKLFFEKEALCMKKVIIGIVTIQLVLLTFFLFVLSETQPIELSQTHQLTMTVEKIDYRRDFNESDLYIYDSSHEYRISKSALSPAYRGVFDLSKDKIFEFSPFFALL